MRKANRNLLNLVGQRFTRLLVLREVERTDPHGHTRNFLCLCDCGNKTIVRLKALRNNVTRSCGCLARDTIAAIGRSLVRDLTGKRFNRLLVLSLTTKRKNRCAVWLCKCDCGTVKEIKASDFKSGKTQSCGCYKSESTTKRLTKHGKCTVKKQAPEYGVWNSMMSRCYNPNRQSYKDYGGRGIRVCERWHKFANFFTDMGPRPSPTHQLDRFPDNDGNYEPGNVRWATRTENAQHTRQTRWVEYQGQQWCLSALARHIGMDRRMLGKRLDRGLSVEQAIQRISRTESPPAS